MITDASGEIRLGWLAAGAIAGLLAVGVGLLRQADDTGNLPDTAVARVNDRVISEAAYLRAVSRLRADSSDPLEAADEAWVLQRLIEEELLVQRGLELGMAQSELNVRNAVVQSLIASVTAEADAASPDDDLLREHMRKFPERFSRMQAVAVEAWSTDDRNAASEFVAGLNEGRPVSAQVARLSSVPEGLLPVAKLRDYLGPGIAAAAAGMAINTSAVYARQDRWLIVRVVDKELSQSSSLDEMRREVLMDYRRHLADLQLREYIDGLRRRANVVLREP